MWPFAGHEEAEGLEIVLRCAVALLMGFVGVGAILMMGFVILTWCGWLLDRRKPVQKLSRIERLRKRYALREAVKEALKEVGRWAMAIMIVLWLFGVFGSGSCPGASEPDFGFWR